MGNNTEIRVALLIVEIYRPLTVIMIKIKGDP